MSKPIYQYSASTSAALPIPYFPSITIVHSIFVAAVIYFLRARSRIALRRAALRSSYNLLCFFYALNILCSAIFPGINNSKVPFPLWLSPFALEMLLSRGVSGYFFPRRSDWLSFPG